MLRGQIRSMVVDLLVLTGLGYEQARDLVPESMTSWCDPAAGPRCG